MQKSSIRRRVVSPVRSRAAQAHLRGSARFAVESLEGRQLFAAVAFYADPAFIDVGPTSASEGTNEIATLTAQGNTVTTFTGTTDAAFTAALAGKDLLVLTDQYADLNAALSPAARTVISNFVSGGGGLIIHGAGDTTVTGFDSAFLNGVFGFSTVSGPSTTSTSSAKAGGAAGTAFAGLAPLIAGNDLTLSLTTASLPAGSKSIFVIGTDTTVGLIPFGSGKIAYLGFDWYAAQPNGPQNGGWLAVLDAAVDEVELVPNTPPTFTVGSNVTAPEDSAAYTQAGFVTAISGPEPGQTVSFATTNNNNALFAVQPAIDAAGQLTFMPAANAFGTATVSVVAMDNGGTAGGGDDTSDPQTFTVTLTSVNDAPTFTVGVNQTVNEDSAAQTVPLFVTAISPGPSNETGQTVAFTTTNNNNALFAAQPAIDALGQLTYTPAANAFGTATVTVVAKDDGGTANGGVDTSAPQTFTITLNAVNDVPSFTKGANQVVAEDAGPQTVLGWATAISKGPANESAQTVSFLSSNNNNALFSAQPAVDAAGNLTYTTAPNAFGTATVTVQIKDNGGTANGGVDTSAAQTFTITVTPVADFSISDASVVEGDAGVQAATFTVTRDTDTGVSAVDYITADGTAGVTGDYNAASGSVVFLAGQLSKTITIGVRGDTNVEADQDFSVFLLNPYQAQIADGQGVGTIVNDDFTPPTIAVGDAAVTEGASGTKSLTFKVSLSAKTDDLVTVKYKTTGASATSGTDFVSTTGTLKFDPFQTEAFITVQVKGDLAIEADEVFYLDLSAPTNATIADSRGVGTIVNDDAKPKITIVDAAPVVEGNSGTRAMTFTVKLSNPTDKAVTVKYATADGTAMLSKNDYKKATGTLTFAAGETTKTITVTIVGDTRKGTPTETLFVNLSSPTNATILDGQGLGTILNDD